MPGVDFHGHTFLACLLSSFDVLTSLKHYPKQVPGDCTFWKLFELFRALQACLSADAESLLMRDPDSHPAELVFDELQQGRQSFHEASIPLRTGYRLMHQSPLNI